jgi:hypothetical protein
MPESAIFRINQPTVISEVIDDEAVIVNLDSGAYYSMRDTAGVIWEALDTGLEPPQIVQRLSRAYQAPHAIIQQSVERFLAELQAEGLIVPTTEPVATATPTTPPPTQLLPFSEPVLEKFTDMSDLLLLDPIHEVDDVQGWPARR